MEEIKAKPIGGIFSSKVFKMTSIILGGVCFVFILAFVAFFFWASAGTLPREKRSEVITYDLPAGTPSSRETFTIMTFNLGYLSAMTNNQPAPCPGKEFFRENLEAFVRLLREIQPDFIGFQEIDFHSRRSHYIDQLRAIAESSGYRYAAEAVNWDKRYVPFPYWPPSVHFGRMLSGQAVLSRWPIISAQRVVLEKPRKAPFYFNALYLDRLAQVVKIQAPDHTLVIFNLHLEAFDRETRERQAQVVLDLYRSLKDLYPILLIGDFNSVPPQAPQKKDFPDEPGSDFTRDRTLHYFLEEPSLRPAEVEVLTFPSDRPTRKLDYIFYNHEKVEFIKVFVPKVGSSDHLPVVMEFSFKSR